MHLKLVLAALFITAASPVLSQVTPQATEGGFPLVLGGGYSNYYTDWSGRIQGETAWADWNFYRAPGLLRGFGVEIEGRDLSWGHPLLKRMRYDTGEGGAIYTWRHFRNFHPYLKYMLGYGSVDFDIGDPKWDHDTRTVHGPAAGIEYRAWKNIWVRGDYEYQNWPQMIRDHTLNPDGFTIGAEYDFRRRHFHKSE